MVTIQDTSGQDVQRSTRPSRKKAIAAAVIVGIAALLTALAVPAFIRWSSSERSVNTERLRFATVERGQFTRDVSVQGRIVAAVSPTLYSPAAGTVSFHVQAGAAVDEGQAIATVESPELQNLLDQERATLDGLETASKRGDIDARTRILAQQKVVDDARVALTAAEREMRRAQTAYEREAISELDFERAKDDVESARLQFKHSQAEAALLVDLVNFEAESQASAVNRQRLNVDELERQVAQLQINSPVTGMIGNLNVSDRSFVAANQPLMSVVDLTAFEVEAQIPESYADNLGLGMPAEVRWGQEHFTATIAAISPEITNNQVRSRLRFDSTPPPGIRQNQRVTARIILEDRPDTLYVRRGPFYDSGGGRLVYRINGDVAERTLAQFGAIGVDRIEVLDGLNVGDQIVLSSIDAFQDAEQVMLND